MTTGVDGTLFLGESDRRACLYLYCRSPAPAGRWEELPSGPGTPLQSPASCVVIGSNTMKLNLLVIVLSLIAQSQAAPTNDTVSVLMYANG